MYTPYQGVNAVPDVSITTEGEELLILNDVLERMNLANPNDDHVIYSQIRAVRYAVEKKFNMSLCESQGITAYWKYWSQRIELPMAPIISVETVTLVNLSDGTEETTTGYWVEGVNEKSVIMETVTSGYGLKIEYTAGITNQALLQIAKDAILSEVMMWYFQRGQSAENSYNLGEIASQKLGIFRKL